MTIATDNVESRLLNHSSTRRFGQAVHKVRRYSPLALTMGYTGALFSRHPKATLALVAGTIGAGTVISSSVAGPLGFAASQAPGFIATSLAAIAEKYHEDPSAGLRGATQAFVGEWKAIAKERQETHRRMWKGWRASQATGE